MIVLRVPFPVLGNREVKCLLGVARLPISVWSTLVTFLTNDLVESLFCLIRPSSDLYLVARTGDPTPLGSIVTRPAFPLAGTSRPPPCRINLAEISPLSAVVWAVGAFKFPCLVLLGTLLVLVALTVVRRELLAQRPGGEAPFLWMLVEIALKTRFLRSTGREVLALLLLLGLDLPNFTWQRCLILPYLVRKMAPFPVANKHFR